MIIQGVPKKDFENHETNLHTIFLMETDSHTKVAKLYFHFCSEVEIVSEAGKELPSRFGDQQ